MDFLQNVIMKGYVKYILYGKGGITMRWTREEYIELMTFGRIDRQMFTELFGPLVGLEEEWLNQGASQAEINMIAFDWDYVPIINCGGSTGFKGGLKPVIIEDTREHILQRDEMGRTTKLLKGFATIPLPVDYPVKDMDSWLKMKPFYEYTDDRVDWQAVEQASKAQQEGILVRASIPGGFDTPRQLMGDEEACIAYYEQPELIQDIMDTITNTSLKVFERICDHLVIDSLSIHEDMAGKSGPLIGPNLVKQYIKPYYRKIIDFLSAHGTKIFSQDSDGNMNPVIDAFLDCGLNTMYPNEPAAGMDIVQIRKKYGKSLALKGGIDKHVLRQSKEDIRRELEYKMQPIMQQGGTVFGLDHRIPNGTPLENYRYYVETGREILGLPPLDPSKTGWQRMAF
jgi:uroporphyrinogen-III decarboxylase